jgi:hypothetical protein
MSPNDTDQSDRIELQELRKARSLRNFCESLPDLVNSSDVATLISPSVNADEMGVINVASAQSAIRRLQEQRPYLFRSSRAERGYDQTGIAPPRQLSDTELAPKLFGRLSSSKDAARLMASDKASYHRIKLRAIEMDLISA